MGWGQCHGGRGGVVNWTQWLGCVCTCVCVCVQGAVVGLKIRWHCLLSLSTCTFEYKAARLDYPERTVTPGFNFRCRANSHCNVCMYVCMYGTWCVCVCMCVCMVLQSTCHMQVCSLLVRERCPVPRPDQGIRYTLQSGDSWLGKSLTLGNVSLHHDGPTFSSL